MTPENTRILLSAILLFVIGIVLTRQMQSLIVAFVSFVAKVIIFALTRLAGLAIWIPTAPLVQRSRATASLNGFSIGPEDFPTWLVGVAALITVGLLPFFSLRNASSKNSDIAREQNDTSEHQPLDSPRPYGIQRAGRTMSRIAQRSRKEK